ncbi:hypothetical protein AYI68_g6645 [Smittium mucronatum]|uniref:Uncharacterized protein n=1 Tax=Smittium mucronatum TaxID=133383 RepID=A0A1R0GQW6_9FUNG|nr:hypothetical protein AYI68_g6645 [Smittium mucronatum]
MKPQLLQKKLATDFFKTCQVFAEEDEAEEGGTVEAPNQSPVGVRLSMFREAWTKLTDNDQGSQYDPDRGGGLVNDKKCNRESKEKESWLLQSTLYNPEEDRNNNCSLSRRSNFNWSYQGYLQHHNINSDAETNGSWLKAEYFKIFTESEPVDSEFGNDIQYQIVVIEGPHYQNQDPSKRGEQTSQSW